MNTEVDELKIAFSKGLISRRKFLSSLAILAAAGYGVGGNGRLVSAQGARHLAVNALNHMTISVSDPAASLEWYQGLFGLPIAARQANTIVLQVGEGPQFIAIGGGSSDNPRITH